MHLKQCYTFYVLLVILLQLVFYYYYFFFMSGTHPCRVNSGPVHRTLESFSTQNWLNHWLFTGGVWPQGIVCIHKVLNLGGSKSHD
jgi:hypothetical protein